MQYGIGPMKAYAHAQYQVMKNYIKNLLYMSAAAGAAAGAAAAAPAAGAAGSAATAGFCRIAANPGTYEFIGSMFPGPASPTAAGAAGAAAGYFASPEEFLR